MNEGPYGPLAGVAHGGVGLVGGRSVREAVLGMVKSVGECLRGLVAGSFNHPRTRTYVRLLGK